MRIPIDSLPRVAPIDEPGFAGRGRAAEWQRGVVDVRDALRAHPYCDHAEEFSARYDVPAFDPERRTPDLSFFEPMLRSLFARPKRSA